MLKRKKWKSRKNSSHSERRRRKEEDFFKGANDVKCVFDAFVIQSIKERYIIKETSIQSKRKDEMCVRVEKKEKKI